MSKSNTSEIIWVTGAEGFIGSALVKALSADDCYVLGFGRMQTDNLFELSSEGLRAAINRYGIPSKVFHLAGGSSVGYSIDFPEQDFSSNVQTTKALIGVLDDYPSIHCIFASSAATYGAGHEGMISTSASLNPTSPYGSNKIMAESLLLNCSRKSGVPITICRIFSVFGEGLKKQLIFDACKRFSGLPPGSQIDFGGTGNEKRDWLYIDDVVFCCRRLERPSAGEVRLYNLGAGVAVTNSDILNRLVSIWGSNQRIAFSGMPRAGDPLSLVAHPDSLPPGFVVQTPLADGLSLTVNWFKSKLT